MFRVCVCGLLAIAAWAQQAPADPAAVVDSFTKQTAPLADAWLKSADARLRAWGTYLVLRDRRTDEIPTLLTMLGEHAAVADMSSQADIDNHAAMLGVLDALIQFGVSVPSADAQRMYPEFPVQSLILLSRAPDDPAAALLDIFNSESPRAAAWLAAGNLLLARRADGFAAAVWEHMTVHVQITVREPNAGGGYGGGQLCCGLGGSMPPRVAWPPLGVYSFGGCGSRVQPGAILLAAGPDPAYYNRQETASYFEESGSGCCMPDKDLVREHYLTALLGAAADQPPVRAHVSRTIVWQGAEAYRNELAAFIADQQRAFAEVARRLGEQNLLTAEDAKTLRPALDVNVRDERSSRSGADTLPGPEGTPAS